MDSSGFEPEASSLRRKRSTGLIYEPRCSGRKKRLMPPAKPRDAEGVYNGAGGEKVLQQNSRRVGKRMSRRFFATR